jgi:hypothetical protein
LTSRQIAQDLGVQYVPSGRLRKSGNRIRVSVEPTHAESEAQGYDDALIDVFDLQDNISGSVAGVVDPAARGAVAFFPSAVPLTRNGHLNRTFHKVFQHEPAKDL